MTLTKDQRDKLAKLMREHVKLQADNLMLKKILSHEHRNRKAVTDWRVDFSVLQQSDHYLRIIEEGDKDIREVLAEVAGNEAFQKFLKTPPTDPEN